MTMIKGQWFAAACVLILGAWHVQAQQNVSRRAPTPARNQTASRPASNAQDTASASSAASPDDADLAITANVTARELRFEEVPNPTVEFTGTPERLTVWEADRENLPRPVQPGVTYRDIGIRLRITSRFADIERIVAEALGETPMTDDTPPATASPAPSTSNNEPTNNSPNADSSSNPPTR